MHTPCTCTECQGRAHRAHGNAHALHSLHSCCWLTPHVLRARCAFHKCTLHTGCTLTAHTLHVGCTPTAFILMFTRCADTECTFRCLQMHLHCTYTVSYMCKLVVLHTHCTHTARTLHTQCRPVLHTLSMDSSSHTLLQLRVHCTHHPPDADSLPTACKPTTHAKHRQNTSLFLSKTSQSEIKELKRVEAQCCPNIKSAAMSFGQTPGVGINSFTNPMGEPWVQGSCGTSTMSPWWHRHVGGAGALQKQKWPWNGLNYPNPSLSPPPDVCTALETTSTCTCLYPSCWEPWASSWRTQSCTLGQLWRRWNGSQRKTWNPSLKHLQQTNRSLWVLPEQLAPPDLMPLSSLFNISPPSDGISTPLSNTRFSPFLALRSLSPSLPNAQSTGSEGLPSPRAKEELFLMAFKSKVKAEVLVSIYNYYFQQSSDTP